MTTPRPGGRYIRDPKTGSVTRAGDTHTRSEERGDAAGKASAAPVKPQANSDHAEAIPAEAEKRTPTPEAEASASGDTIKAAPAATRKGK
jgi:hypothetical protein